MDAEYSIGLIHLLTVGSVINNLPANAADVGSISESERCPGEGNDNSFQDSCLGNPMDRERRLVGYSL